MSKQTINIGTSANDRSGDSLRAAFNKVNQNFTELYTALGLDSGGLNLGAFEFTGSTISTTDSSGITIDQATTVSSDLTVGGDILPNVANGGDLGSLAKPWRSLYVSNNTVFLGGVPLSLEAGTNELKINNVPISQTLTYADIPNVPTDIGDLTDTGNLLSSGGADTGDITFSGVKIQGAGTASGDGNGYSTIELVPDADLYNNDQYLIIDPTEPQHIHIRAGGTIDNSSASLYLGGELNYVRVVDDTGVRLQNRTRNDTFYNFVDPTDFNTATWFEDNGNFYVRFTAVNAEIGDLAFIIGDDDENTVTVYYGGGSSQTLTYGSTSSNLGGGVYRFSVVEAPPTSPTVLTAMDFQIWTNRTNSVVLSSNDFSVTVTDDIRIEAADTFSLRNISRTEPISIRTDYDNSNYGWTFNPDGNLTLPGNLQSEGDISIDINLSDSTLRRWTFTEGGDLTFPDGTTQTTAFTGGGNVSVNTDFTVTVDSGDSSPQVWSFDTSGILNLPNGQTIEAADPNQLQIGSPDAALTLDSNRDAAVLTAKKSFDRFFVSGGIDDENINGEFGQGIDIIYYDDAGQGVIEIYFLPNAGAGYLRELLRRLNRRLDYDDQDFVYDYRNIRIIVNPNNEPVTVNVTNVRVDDEEYEFNGNPPIYYIEVDRIPDPDPTVVYEIRILYDYYNAVGLDRDRDIYGISTDNDDIDFVSGRDIELRSGDDITMTANSNLRLRLNRYENQDSDQGIEIVTRSESPDQENLWTFRFDGDLELPSSGGIVSENDINIRVNLTDSTTRIWRFGEDGSTTFPGSITFNGALDFTNADSIQNFAPGDIYAKNGEFLYVISRNNSGSATNVAFTYDTNINNVKQTFYGKTEFSNNGQAPIVDFTGATVTGLTLDVAKNIESENDVNITINNDDSSTYTWNFGNTGDLTAPGIVSAAGLRTSESEIALGNGAGTTNQGSFSVAIGANVGYSNQGAFSVALGTNAGENDQNAFGIAIGANAGQTSQNTFTVAIGANAGQTNQDTNSVAIGVNAGQTSQGTTAIGIGVNAGNNTQGSYAIAIGVNAGQLNQGADAIAIGRNAASSDQAANSIVINATGGSVQNTTADSFVVKPVRNASGTSILQYDSSTGEISHTNDIYSDQQVSITVAGEDSTSKTWYFGNDGDLTFPDSTVQTTAFTASPTLNILKIDDGVHEKLQVKSDATGTVTHDCSLGHIFYHVTPEANWTVNLTNLNLTFTYATTVTIIQSGGVYYPSAVQIGGSAQTIQWQGGAAPTPDSDSVNIITFSILNVGNEFVPEVYVVLGQMTSFDAVA